MGRGFTINGTTMQTVITTAERLLTPGAINLSWQDINRVLFYDGQAVIAFGSGTGVNRAIEACDDTISAYRPAAGTERPVRALFRVTGPANLLLQEVNEVREAIEMSIRPAREVTFGVTIDNSLDDEVRIVLLAAVEEKPASGVIIKHYTPAEAGLVDEWTNKWLELIDFINRVTGPGELPGSPSPPTETDELRYAGLRFWFLGRQEQFVPLLKDFCASQNWPSSQDSDDPDDCPEKYLENPFLYFYEPENLYQLAQQLELQSGTDTWEPSESVASRIRPVIIDMGKRMIQFLDWIEERV